MTEPETGLRAFRPTFVVLGLAYVLLGDTLRAVDAVVLDPGTSHHRMTQVDIEPR